MVKDILKSKTILSVVFVAIAAIAGRHGYVIDTELLKSDLSDIFVITGAAVAIYSRITAKGPITKKPKGET